MTRWNSALPFSAIAAAMLAAAMPAGAQQLQDQTASRFPPDPLEYTNQLTIGDIDGDGDLDIIFANGQGYSSAGAPLQLRIYINNGSGVFTDESVVRAPGALFIARGAELGDVDGDGDLDIIVAQDFQRQPQLLINIGSGFFVNETALRLPTLILSSSRGQFADVDNDGDLDIYFVNGGTSRFGSGKGVLLINDGTGHFTDETATRMPSENVAQPMDCIFGDVDGNFTLDLVIASRNSPASSTNAKLYKNNGAGVFTSSAMPSSQNCYSFDEGDIDGDGDLDLLGANAHPTSTNSELLLRNNGSGTFTALTALPSSSGDDNDSKFFDVDNDGDLDLIIASLGSTERIYLNNGTGTYTLASGMITAISDASLDVKVADLNGDGRLDVVTAQGESGNFTNRIYINVTGLADTIAPRIVKTETIADTMNTAGPYVVRTVVYDSMTSDRGFHDKGVTLNYAVNGGPTLEVPMKWVGNSEWRGVIPGQPVGSTVTYFVTARDFANNLGTGTTQTFQILYPPCPADANGDHAVNVSDLLTIINNWGATAQTFEVSVMDFSFSPPTVNVKSGDSVRWNWVNGIHTITSGANCTGDGRFNQALSSGMWQYMVPANFSGSIPYFCSPHCASGMTGTINVSPFTADVNGDSVVNVSDLLGVINAWGPCPH